MGEINYIKEPENPTERLAERIKRLCEETARLAEINKGLTVQTVMLMKKMDDLMKSINNVGDVFR